MSEIYLSTDVKKLLHDKFVVVIGSSVQRTMYKDLVKLLKKDDYLNDKELRAKGEFKYEDDELLEGGRKDKMSNCISYKEVREYKTDFHLLRFYFITKCYNKYVESILNELNQEPRPDVVILNSCLWDISRYGFGNDAIETYAKNLHSLCQKLKEVLPKETLVMWNSTLPVDKDAKGGLFVPEVENIKTHLGMKILACNQLAHHIITHYDFDYLDVNYFLKYHLHRRAEDGVHWDMTAHRRMTNLLLSHIAEAWNVLINNPTQPMSNTETAPKVGAGPQKKKDQKKGKKACNKNLKHIPYSHFTKDTYFDDNYDNFIASQQFHCGGDYHDMISEHMAHNFDENVDPNEYDYQQTEYYEYNHVEPFKELTPLMQNFQWQEYHQDHLQQRYTGVHHHGHNRQRFQPYGNHGHEFW